MRKFHKGEQGYIDYKKKVQTIIVISFVLAGLSLFFICKWILGTGRNLGTVVAVLLTLPAAKALVNLILFLPHRSTDITLWEKAEAIRKDDDKMYYDLVFTSEQSTMHLDALCARGNELIAYSKDGAKQEKILSYFTDSMKKRGVGVHMHIFRNEESFLQRMQDCNEDGPVPEEITEFIRIILVS